MKEKIGGMDEFSNVNATASRNAVIANLLKHEETRDLYNRFAKKIIKASQSGLLELDEGIWESQSCTYTAKQNVITIFKLKGYNVSPSCGIINWGVDTLFVSEDTSY